MSGLTNSGSWGSKLEEMGATFGQGLEVWEGPRREEATTFGPGVELTEEGRPRGESGLFQTETRLSKVQLWTDQDDPNIDCPAFEGVGDILDNRIVTETPLPVWEGLRQK